MAFDGVFQSRSSQGSAHAPARGQAAPATHLFIATTFSGGRTIGVRQARDQRQLAEQLRREQMVPTRVWTLPAGLGGTGSSKVSLKNQAEVHLQLSQLLSRGVPLVEALEVTATAVAPAVRPRIERVRELVAAGSGFADAAQTVEVFDPITVAVYRASERSGDLAGAARQLMTTTRRQLAIAGKAVTLVIYPAIVLSISVIVTTFLLMFVVPKIGSAIANAGGEIPVFTQVLIDVGTFMREQWAWVLAAFGLVVTGAVVARSLIAAGIVAVSRRLPLVRPVLEAQESARFFTVMAAMSRSGVTLADALTTATGAVSDPVLVRQLTRLRTRLVEGGVLRSLIQEVEALPLTTRRLLIAAERAGDLQEAFDTLADDATSDLERRSTRLMAALEPALIVVMFLMVGTLVLSIMTPLIKMAGNVQ
ncbi:MAG: type II secretion system F family protein [Phycisphaerae bacterium]|nr:type II secretion system F family protein [Phycisphaerae bacterium]